MPTKRNRTSLEQAFHVNGRGQRVPRRLHLQDDTNPVRPDRLMRDFLTQRCHVARDGMDALTRHAQRLADPARGHGLLTVGFPKGQRRINDPVTRRH